MVTITPRIPVQNFVSALTIELSFLNEQRCSTLWSITSGMPATISAYQVIALLERIKICQCKHNVVTHEHKIFHNDF